MEEIPIVDIRSLIGPGNENEKIEVAKSLVSAASAYGFFYIIGHGVSEDLQNDLLSASRTFFALPLSKKEQIGMEIGGRAWRGYFPVGGELTSGRPDIKEGIYFGDELPNDDRRVVAQLPMHGKNLFPDEDDVPRMKSIILEYMDQVGFVAHKVVESLASGLGQRGDPLKRLFANDSLRLFRIFHYPEGNGEGWGVGEHTDYGVLTLLKQEEVSGLEVKGTKGWISAQPVPNSFVCNIGDMLERLSGGILKSTPHRVQRPEVNRLSFPLFFDPPFEAELENIGGEDHERWDGESVHRFQETYGQYLLKKVGKVFPQLNEKVF